uniref:7TM GPCR serpentine receptor class x (Srx) domain-containing protein n=1 Tax=Romanomermis culicivorax TaxID=13658 RepID=A0A915J117_ROMCU
MMNFTCDQPDVDPRYNLTNICMTIWEFSTTVILVPLLCSTYILVLFTLIRDQYKEYRNPFYTFIVFDGVCDLCMMIFSIYSFVYDLFGYSYLGEKIDSFLGYVFYWALGWYGTEIFAFVITTNRLAAIIFNSLYEQYFGIKSARIICLVTFVSAFVLVTPNCVMFGFHYVPSDQSNKAAALAFSKSGPFYVKDTLKSG